MAAAVIGGVVLVGGSLVAAGALPMLVRSPYPACDSLASFGEVQSAIDNHAALIDELEGLGDGVGVDVVQPCPGRDAAVITILYRTDDQLAGIERIMNSDGFGVISVPRRTP